MIRSLFLALMLFINICYLGSGVNAQESGKQYNSQYSPISVVKRLSYENFRNIKLLRAAIFNYGGGEAEVQKLIDQYADATALYFQDKTEEAANKFSENEREIFKIAKKLAGDYHKDSTAFITKGIKRNVQVNIERGVEGKPRDAVMDKYLDNAKMSLKKGSAIFDDYKYTGEKTNSSARRLITSIYYYRMAKQNLFMMYQAYSENMELETDKDGKKIDPKKEKEMRAEMFDKLLKEDYKSDYKKDMQDNNNKVYVSMEKRT
ncbi:MAG TPA: hypothetical protein PK906_03160 [Spirochaetota bacterium]|nr:hypothetical protein [Spirochaetota bacterium]